jgi:hypothetical protein
MRRTRLLLSLIVAGLLSPVAPVLAQGAAPPDPSPPRHVDLRGVAAIPLVASGVGGGADIPVIEVFVNGKGPFRFGVETGAGFIALSPGFAAAQGLARIGGPDDAPLFRIDSVTLPGAAFHTLGATELPRGPTGVDGILGLPFFETLLLTIDYPRREVRLERGALPAANGQDILQLTKAGPFWAVPVEVAGLRSRAVLDTRSMGSLGVAPAMADSLSFASPPVVVGMARGAGFAPTEVKAGQLDGDLKIGHYRITRPTIGVRALPSWFPQEATLGARVLKHFAVTLDQANARLRLTRDGGTTLTI